MNENTTFAEVRIGPTWKTSCDISLKPGSEPVRVYIKDRLHKDVYSVSLSISEEGTAQMCFELVKDSERVVCDRFIKYVGCGEYSLVISRREGVHEINADVICHGASVMHMCTSSIDIRDFIRGIYVCIPEDSESITNLSLIEERCPPDEMQLLLASHDRSEPDFFFTLAKQAVKDMLRNFWEGDFETGKLVATWNGYYGDNIPDKRGGPWETSHIIYGLYDMWLITNDPFYEKLLRREADFYRTSISAEEWENAGGWLNWASDDCIWNAMELLLFYDVTGDDWFYTRTVNLLQKTVDRWYDSELGGILYSDNLPFMSLYEVAFAACSLRLWEISGDRHFYDWALRSYEAMHLRLGTGRDDGIYFCEANLEGYRGKYDTVGTKGSSSFLTGNMGMAALSAKFYRITGNEEYLSRMHHTNDGIVKNYNGNGVLANDRDAWQEASFAAFYVFEVLSQPGTEEMRKLFLDTVYSIASAARTHEGYYYGNWEGPAGGSAAHDWFASGSTPEQAHTSGNGMRMLTAAALYEAGIRSYIREEK